MIKKYTKYLLLLLPLLWFVLPAAAQGTTQEQAKLDYYTESGQLVFYVLMVIFSGLFLFLFFMERKLAKMEKQMPNNEEV